MSTKSGNPQFAPKFDEPLKGMLVKEHGCFVEANGRAIEFFGDHKDAGAFIQHVYGMLPRDARKSGIEIRPMRDRGPKVGDALIYDGSGDHYHAGTGILCTICGDLHVCFNASAFRVGDSVSCSGGPLPQIRPHDLTLIGLRETTFWCWHDGEARADSGGNYSMTVPFWRWNGNEERGALLPN